MNQSHATATDKLVTVMTAKKQFDVIIVGGSYAGLSAAMALGRSLKNVLVIDSGKPCNRYTPHSHNFITQDGSTPGEIATKAKEQVLRYPTVTFMQGIALNGIKSNDGFEVETNTGSKVHAAKLVFATGISDILPATKGFEDCWGKSVIHCPYCHGYEFKEKKTAIIANGDKAVHIAALVNNLTGKIGIFSNGKADFTPAQSLKLKEHRIAVNEKVINEIRHSDGQVTALLFEDGSSEQVEAAYAVIPFEQQCNIPEKLGCALTETGLIKVDTFQKTTVQGIYACGDNSSPLRSVANAVATGNFVGAMLNNELTMERW